MALFETCVDFTMRPENEGAYVNNPEDPGGPTNFGITLQGLSIWRGQSCTAQDVRLLSPAEARAIYHVNYWKPIAGDDLPVGVDLMVFDFGVNHGPQSAARMLQRIVGAAPDGDIGPRTIAQAVCGGAVLRARIAALAAAQEAFYTALHNPVFTKGWLARTKRRRTAAMMMTAGQAVPAPPSASGAQVTNAVPMNAKQTTHSQQGA